MLNWSLHLRWEEFDPYRAAAHLQQVLVFGGRVWNIVLWQEASESRILPETLSPEPSVPGRTALSARPAVPNSRWGFWCGANPRRPPLQADRIYICPSETAVLSSIYGACRLYCIQSQRISKRSQKSSPSVQPLRHKPESRPADGQRCLFFFQFRTSFTGCGGRSSIQLKIHTVFNRRSRYSCAFHCSGGAAAGVEAQLRLPILALNVFAAMFEGRVILLRLTKIEGSSYFAPLLRALFPLPGNEALRIRTACRNCEDVILFRSPGLQKGGC